MKTLIKQLAHALLLVTLVAPMVASAEICPQCREKAFTADVGTCKGCGGDTSSGAFSLCPACSKKKGQCEACQAQLHADKPLTVDAEKEKPAAHFTRAALLAAPTEIVLGEKLLELEATLWRNSMPGADLDKSLIASIKIKTSARGILPEGITVEKVWIVNGNDLWSPKALEFSDPIKDSQWMEIIARKGPQWEIGSKVHVIVKMKDEKGKSFLLKIDNQLIKAVS